MAAEHRAICSARLRHATAEHRRIVGLADDDLRVGPTVAEHARNAFERSAGAKARDPVIEPFTGEGVEDLGCRRARMDIGVRFVLELTAQKPTVRLRPLTDAEPHNRLQTASCGRPCVRPPATPRIAS